MDLSMDDIPVHISEVPEEDMDSSQLYCDEDKKLLVHTLPRLATKHEISKVSSKGIIDVNRDSSVLMFAGHDSPAFSAQCTEPTNHLKPEDKDCSIHSSSSYQPVNDNLPNFKVGDMVWGKVKSHPWWPGQIFSAEDASAAAKNKQIYGRHLVAFFGDGTYGWLQSSQLVDFREHFKEKASQTTMKSFCKAVSEALEEVCRRSEIGIACFCHNGYFHNTSTFPDSNIGIREMGLRIKTHSDISMSKTVFCPVKILKFVKTVACFPLGTFSSNLEMSEMRGQVFGIRSGLVSIMRKHEEKAISVLKRKSSDIDENCTEQNVKGEIHKKPAKHVFVSVAKVPTKRSPESNKTSGVKKPKKKKSVLAEDTRDDGSQTLFELGGLNSKLLKKTKNRKNFKMESGLSVLDKYDENPAQNTNNPENVVKGESDLGSDLPFPQSIYTQFAAVEQNSLAKSDSSLVFEHLQALKLVARDALIKAYMPDKIGLAVMSLMKYRDIVYQKSPGYGSSLLSAEEQNVFKKLKRPSSSTSLQPKPEPSQTISSSSKSGMQSKESNNLEIEVSEGNKNTTIHTEEGFQILDTEWTNENMQLKCKQQSTQSLEAKASNPDSAPTDCKCKIEEILEENEDAHIAQSWDRGKKPENVQPKYESSQTYKTKGVIVSPDKQTEASKLKNMPSVSAATTEIKYKLNTGNSQLKYESTQTDDTKSPIVLPDKQIEAFELKNTFSVSEVAMESTYKLRRDNIMEDMERTHIADNWHVEMPSDSQQTSSSPKKVNEVMCVHSGSNQEEMKCHSEHKHTQTSKRGVQKNTLGGAGMDIIDPVNPVCNALLSDCYLFMRFPEGMRLPSESYLKSLFVKFGPLRTSGIKVFKDRLLARVAFKHPKDAKSALNYAKRKHLFGQTSVVFWLKTYQNRQKPEPSSGPDSKLTVSSEKSAQQIPERHRNVDKLSTKTIYMAELPSNVDMKVDTSSHPGVEKSTERHINVHTISSKTIYLAKMPTAVDIKPGVADKPASLVNVNEPQERMDAFTTSCVAESSGVMQGEKSTLSSYLSESHKRRECLPLSHVKINHSVRLCISDRGTRSCNANISTSGSETVIASGLLASETNDGSVKISGSAKTANCNYISLSLQETPVSHVNQPSVDIQDQMLNLLHQLSFLMNSYYHRSIIR